MENKQSGLLGGAARRCITPPAELLQEVRGLMGKKFVAVADDLYVRVLALRQGKNTWLICGFDLDKAPNPESSMRAITETFGIAEEGITFYGIHTHSTPALGHRENETNNNVRRLGAAVVEATERYEAYVHDRLMEAVGDALNQLQPARVRFGSAVCACNINRCTDDYSVDEQGNLIPSLHEGPNPLGPVDRNTYVTAVEDGEGKPIAYLINYAMHNTTMFMNTADEEGNCAVSSDVGGNVSQLVERRFPGTVALWCSGAAGDVSPLHPVVHIRKEQDEKPWEFEFRQKQSVMLKLRDNHYAAVMKAIETLGDPFALPKISQKVCWISVPGRTIIREGRGKVQVLEGPDQPPYRIRLHFVKLGELLVIGIGGELYAAYALTLKEKFPQYHVLVVNHDASMIEDAGYIMDDATWERVSRFPAEARTVPGAPPRYEKGNIAATLLEAAEQTVEQFEKEEETENGR